MFILTIDSNNEDEILKALKELTLDTFIKQGCAGLTKNGVQYEYDVLPEQKWAGLCKILRFKKDGNTLKLK